MKKALFVTGGTVGTGLAIAHRFARAGYAVFISSRSEERAQAAAREVAAVHGVTASGYALDIQDEPRIQAIFQDIDAQDCFVETIVLNSADLGFGADPAKGQDFFTVPAAEFQRVFETNLVWNFMLIRQAALRMRTQGRGAIVFISSNTADRAIPGRVAYCASKGGINAMSGRWRWSWGPMAFAATPCCPAPSKPPAGRPWATPRSSTASSPPSAIFPILRILPTPSGFWAAMKVKMLPARKSWWTAA